MDDTLLKLIEDLNEYKNELLKFREEEPIRFIRTPQWSGWTVWGILLDNSKTKYVKRTAQGFSINDSHAASQVIVSNKGTADLLLSKNKADRNVAITILNQLAIQKYGGSIEE